MTQKIILYIATSIDGFIAKKDGSVKWLDNYNSSGEDFGYNEFIKKINTVVMGNTTYKQILGFGEFPYKNQKCYVFSSKEKKDKNATFVNGNVKKFINSLNEQKINNIWIVGGANLVNQFIKENLIDEYQIFIMPTLLGSGIRLFENNNQESQLLLKKTKTYKSGVIELKYITNK